MSKKKKMPVIDLEALRSKSAKSSVSRVFAYASSVHRVGRSEVSGSYRAAKLSKSGRFSEGVRHVSVRDRAGLIKLADR